MNEVLSMGHWCNDNGRGKPKQACVLRGLSQCHSLHISHMKFETERPRWQGDDQEPGPRHGLHGSLERQTCVCICTWISKTFSWLVGRSNTTEQISPWDAKRGTASQKIPSRLQNLEFPYHIYRSLSWANRIHFIWTHPTSLRSILLLLSSRACLCSTIRYYFQKFVHISHLSHACYAPRPSHPLIW